MKAAPKDWSEVYLKIYVCPVCKNTFIKSSSLHAYKMPNNGRYVCSYHCMRQAEAEYEAKKKKHRTYERKEW
jgi:hypothetical protein